MPQFSTEQEAFLDAVRRMVDRAVRPIAAEIDETERFPAELVPIYGDMGLLQLWTPEEYGGPGGNLTLMCIAREEIARASLACSMMVAQNALGMVYPLTRFGSEEQRRRWLPDIAKGRTITAVALTEPQGGSDAAGLRTRATRQGSDWIINGSKAWITFASLAEWILVYARSGDPASRGFSGISAFLVDAKTPGIRIEPRERLMGMHGLPNCMIHFDDVRVPAENLIGDEGRGFIQAMKIFEINRPSVAAMAVGLAQGALDAAAAYAREREAFGQPIAGFQGIQFMLADMAIRIEAARALVYDIAAQVDAGNLDRLNERASMAKCFATDVAMQVTTDAVQVFGGAGYSRDHPVERMMRDAKLLQIYEGTNQIQRVVIAGSLLKNAG
jgi:alkylation response protein AidB-like acyl-CoA dehydrogenase